MDRGWSRRSILSLLPAGLAAQTRAPGVYLPEARRYADPSTEFPVLRLTNPEITCHLPSLSARAIARRSSFLLHASDRSGSLQVWRLDLKSLQARMLTAAGKLHPRAISLLPDERSFLYLDGDVLKLAPLGGGKVRDVWKISPGRNPSGWLTVSDDGIAAVVGETDGTAHRLTNVTLSNGGARVVEEGDQPLSHPWFRPGSPVLLYRRGAGEIRVADAGRVRTLAVAAKDVRSPHWTADGAAVTYLALDGGRSEVREVNVASGADKVLGRTSGYVQFARNTDGSVWVGASGSKAQPFVLLMVRSVRRELAICEHKTADAEAAGVRFTPNSQRIVFESTRHGKAALYLMNVERLVEETESAG